MRLLYLQDLRIHFTQNKGSSTLIVLHTYGGTWNMDTVLFMLKLNQPSIQWPTGVLATGQKKTEKWGEGKGKNSFQISACVVFMSCEDQVLILAKDNADHTISYQIIFAHTGQCSLLEKRYIYIFFFKARAKEWNSRSFLNLM